MTRMMDNENDGYRNNNMLLALYKNDKAVDPVNVYLS